MFAKLIAKWREWRQSRKLAEEIDPSVFLAMAAELRDLADTASKLWQANPPYMARAQRILDEMNQLEHLASRPEFKRLSSQKRQELRQSLLLSRDQLLESMQASPPVTNTIQ